LEKQNTVVSEINDQSIHNLQMYKTIFSMSLESMFILEDNKIVDCNNSTLEVFKYKDKNTFLNLELSELSPEFQLDGQNSSEKTIKILKILLEKKTYVQEWLFKKSDEEVFCVEAFFTNISSKDKNKNFIVLKDINDRKNMETRFLDLNETLMQKTKKLESYKKLISENVIHSQTDLNGIIIDVSDAFCKMSGYTKEELIGKSHKVLRHPNTPKLLYKNLWDTIKSGKQWSGIIENKKKDGTNYWIEMHITPEYNEHGNIFGYLAIRDNITSKVELENLNKNLEQTIHDEVENSRQQELQLFSASKLASMGEMIANIAHQWRQPLGTISAIAYNVKLLNELDTLDKEEIPKSMDEIAEHAKYLSYIIDTFRNFLKDNKENITISIQEILDESLQIIDSVLRDNHIKIINEIDYSDPIVITISKGELSQVIINIMNNAKDIILEKNITNPFIILNLIQIKSKAIITIEDNAGGIPEEILPKIFDPYFTTKHQSNGTGLGLHMSYKIITESLHGKLYATNTRNGAKFFIELPTKDDLLTI